MYATTIGKPVTPSPTCATCWPRRRPLRSGDVLAGVAAGSDRERAAAQAVLADVPLTRFLEEPVIPYESDDVTRLILDTPRRAALSRPSAV